MRELLAAIAESFQRNLIDGNAYQIVLKGLWVTVQISVLRGSPVLLLLVVLYYVVFAYSRINPVIIAVIGCFTWMKESFTKREHPLIFLKIRRSPKRKFSSGGLKLFHYTIISRDFDLIAMNAQIELFSQKHQITPKKKYHIQLILKELLVEIMKNCYQEESPKCQKLWRSQVFQTLLEKFWAWFPLSLQRKPF